MQWAPQRFVQASRIGAESLRLGHGMAKLRRRARGSKKDVTKFRKIFQTLARKKREIQKIRRRKFSLLDREKSITLVHSKNFLFQTKLFIPHV